MLSGLFIGSVLSLSLCDNKRPLHVNNRHPETSTRNQLQNHGSSVGRESGALSVFRPPTPHLLRTIVPFTKKEHGT